MIFVKLQLASDIFTPTFTYKQNHNVHYTSQAPSNIITIMITIHKSFQVSN